MADSVINPIRHPTEATYSNKVGLLFVFNLIVGTGALALPKSFQVAGYASSVILIHISCLTSFICATFVIESMAIANAAILRKKRRDSGEDINTTVFIESYSIKNRTEVSEMAQLFFNRLGLLLSYLFLVLYLFGDLAIYCTTVSKSIMNILCDPVRGSVNESDPCWRKSGLSFDRGSLYKMSTLTFAALMTPLVLIGLTRTKYLQISTSFSRWTAFVLMITLASISLIKNGPEAFPHFANLSGFGPLFGTTVYAFMCHHSLPGLVTPMKQKRSVMGGIGIVYIIVLLFYITLSLTGSYAFQKVFDVYTLNFFHDEDSQLPLHKILNYFLALFPVFTLSTNYPIVANTLANNLYTLYEMFSSDQESSADGERRSLLNPEVELDPSPSLSGTLRVDKSNLFVRRCCLLAVIIIPMVISCITDNVLLLASLTGSYPGVGVQYIIPSLLVIYARRYNKKEFGTYVPSEASSPFRSLIWPVAMLLWSAFAIVMVTLNLMKI